jgi:hypothetical protein
MKTDKYAKHKQVILIDTECRYNEVHPCNLVQQH